MRLKARAAVARSSYSDRKEPSAPVDPLRCKFAAIFAADIAGYTQLMARDEIGTPARACRMILDGLIASHRGRIFNTAGDSGGTDVARAVDAGVILGLISNRVLAATQPSIGPGQIAGVFGSNRRDRRRAHAPVPQPNCGRQNAMPRR